MLKIESPFSSWHANTKALFENDENISENQLLELKYLINDFDPFMEHSFLFIKGMVDRLMSLQRDTEGPPKYVLL